MGLYKNLSIPKCRAANYIKPDAEEIKASFARRKKILNHLKEQSLSRKWVKWQQDNSGSMLFESGRLRPKKLGYEAPVGEILASMLPTLLNPHKPA